MLSAEKNERLTRVGEGTPTGELPRRHRWPIATNPAYPAAASSRNHTGPAHPPTGPAEYAAAASPTTPADRG